MTDQKYMNMVNVLRANGIIKERKKPKNGVASIYKPDEELRSQDQRSKEMERLKNMTDEERMKRMIARIQKEQTERMKRNKANEEYRKKHHGRNLK